MNNINNLKMKKLLFSLGFFALCSVNAFGQDYTDDQGVQYKFNNDGTTCLVSGYTEDCQGDIVIPSTIQGRKVVAIGETGDENFYPTYKGFCRCKKILSVTIPEGVTSIGILSFAFCDKLEKITIPQSVHEIGEAAFGFCTDLADITLPDGITYLSASFTDCQSLKHINIPSTVETLGTETFSGCYYLETVVIPSSVKNIGQACFLACNKFKDNSIFCLATTPPTIDQNAFFDVFSYGSDRYKELIVPEGCAEAYRQVEQWSKSFETISEVASSQLPIVFKDAKVKAACIAAGFDTNGDSELSYDEVAAVTDETLKNLCLNSDITSFDEFQYFTGVQNLTGDNAPFFNTSNMTSVVLPPTIKTIGAQMFTECVKLERINIPASVTSIAFSSPAGALQSFDQAFASYNLREITVDSNNPNYSSPTGSNAILNKAGTELLLGCMNTVIPNTVTTIKCNAFYGADFTNRDGNISAFSLNGVTTIEEGAFSRCKGLTSISIPNNVTKINKWVFDLCEDLASVTLPNTVTSIDESAFSRCGLTSIAIPSSVTSIGFNAFSECPLTSITIPSSVTTIGSDTFLGCKNVTSITFEGNVTSLSSQSLCCENVTKIICNSNDPIVMTSSMLDDVFRFGSFGGVTGAVLYVPSGKVSAYETAGWKDGVVISQITDQNMISPVAKTLTYTGTAQDLVKPGTTRTDPEWQYSLDGTNYSTSVPQGTAAGEYTVYYRVGSSGESSSFKVTIASKEVNTPTITLSQTSYTYDGTAKEPTVTVKDGETTISSDEYTVGYSNNTNVGTATVTILDKDGGTYTVNGSTTFTITPKVVSEPTITLSQTSYEYDGTAKEPTVTVKDGETTISSDEYTVGYSNNTNVGTATVTITDKDGGNYTVSGSTTFTITPKVVSEPTITLSQTSYEYDGTAKEPTVTVKDGETTISSDEYTVGYSNNTNVGTATVTITDKDGGNYTVSGSTTFTITPKVVSEPTITLSQTSYEYDGTAKEPTVTVKDGETTISSDEYTVGYSNNTNVGTATVTITDKDGGNYTVSGSTTFTITPKVVSEPTITLSQTSYEYDGTAKEPTVTVKDGETTISSDEYTVGYSNNTNAGTASVTISDKDGGTYAVSGSTTFKINKAPLKISVGNYTKKEGEDNPTFSLTYDGFKNNETSTVFTTQPTITCAATKDSPVGSYAITVSGAVAGNYEISYVAGTLTVEAVTPTPEPTGATFVEDVDDSASKNVFVTFTVTDGSSSGTPTVAVSDDKSASGKVEIPETVTHNGVAYKVTEVAEGAFLNNTGLTEVSIPSSIVSIGAYAFAGCKNLQSITINILTPLNLSAVGARGLTRAGGDSVFDGVDKSTCILYVPASSVDKYKAAPVWKEFKNILAIGSATGIFGIEITEGETFDVFSLSGQKVRSQATSLDGLPKGIYIVKGKKVMK